MEKKASVPIFVLLLICAHLAFFTISPIPKAYEVVIVSVVPENIIVKLGQPFTVNVTFDNLPYSTYNGVGGCEFNLTWNASILRATLMQERAFHAATPPTEWWNIWSIENEVTSGYALYVYCWKDSERAVNYSYAPLKGNGSWATITFTSLFPGETDLHFSRLIIGSMTEEILGSGVDGKISVTNILAGDHNQDGTVNSTDAGILSTAFGASPNAANWNSIADINGDNVVDICDAIILAGNYGKVS